MTIEQVRDRIATLGDSIKSALEVLRREKVRGTPGVCDRCVLAKFIGGPDNHKRADPDRVTVHIESHALRVAYVALGDGTEIHLPIHLALLASRFDNAEYLYLLE